MSRITASIVAFVWDGQIPLLVWIRRLLTAAAVIAPLALIAMPQAFKDFGGFGWLVLTVVLLIRPIADILPDIRLLRTLTTLRKELGILAGVLILCHAAGFFIVNQAGVVSGEVWSFFAPPASPLFWGMLGVIMLLPVLLTSNLVSMRFLGRGWKVVQHLVYPAYLLGGVHIYLIKQGDIGALVPVVLVAVCWLLARFGFHITIRRPSVG